MKTMIYLIVGRDGIRSARKTPPPLGAGEIVVALNVDIDDKLFTVPTINAKVTVQGPSQEDVPPQDIVLTAREALRAAGLRAEIVLVPEPETPRPGGEEPNGT